MNEWIKSLFVGDENPTKTIISWTMVGAVVLTFTGAEEWCWMVLVVAAFYIYLIVTSN